MEKKAKKDAKKPPIGISIERVEQIKKETVNYSIELMSCLFIMALRDEFKFGPKRIEQLLHKVSYMYKQFESKEVSSDEMKEVLEMSLGIKINLANVLKANSEALD
jgi:hypothetical protein